jgi:osmotically-inducible protein OsmY
MLASHQAGEPFPAGLPDAVGEATGAVLAEAEAARRACVAAVAGNCRGSAVAGEEILDEVFTRYLGTNPALVRVTVTEGRVTLAGEVEKKIMIPLAVRMSRSVDASWMSRTSSRLPSTTAASPRHLTRPSC